MAFADLFTARLWTWRRLGALFIQALIAAAVLAVAWGAAENALANLARLRINTGFGFLERPAGFAIAQHLVPYSEASTYLAAFVVALLNTLVLALVAILIATPLGFLIGVARRSSNQLVAGVATAYIETLRNLPLLLQLFFWWAMLRISGPAPRQAWEPLPGVLVSNRGFVFPVPIADPAHHWMLLALALGIIGAIAVSRWAKRRQALTGTQFSSGWVGATLIVGMPLLVFLAAGVPLKLDWPELKGFNFVGGSAVSPEFAALLIGLTIYTGSFVAEIVRAGILAVSWGQSEAASALGLRPGQCMRLIVLPQALRVIVPPMTSEYLSLTKNSSLAVAIGYPDLVSIANTTLNQTGQAIEGIAMIMAVYLVISLTISLGMNMYNRAVALVGR